MLYLRLLGKKTKLNKNKSLLHFAAGNLSILLVMKTLLSFCKCGRCRCRCTERIKEWCGRTHRRWGSWREGWCWRYRRSLFVTIRGTSAFLWATTIKRWLISGQGMSRRAKYGFINLLCIVCLAINNRTSATSWNVQMTTAGDPGATELDLSFQRLSLQAESRRL